MWSSNWTFPTHSTASVRRHLTLEAIATKTPETYCLVHSSYSRKPILGFLAFGDWEVLSTEAQQGDPLNSLQFCEAVHPLLCDFRAATNIITKIRKLRDHRICLKGPKSDQKGPKLGLIQNQIMDTLWSLLLLYMTILDIKNVNILI